jgi:hypothetical protein
MKLPGLAWRHNKGRVVAKPVIYGGGRLDRFEVFDMK